MQPGPQDELPERPRGEGYIHALTCRKLFAQSRQLVSTVHMKADGLYPGRGKGSVSETGMTWKQQKRVQSGWKWGGTLFLSSETGKQVHSRGASGTQAQALLLP